MSSRSAAEIQEQAALWVARMDGDHWNAAAESELQAWLEEDSRHDGALLQCQAAWAMLDPSRAAPDLAVRDRPPPAQAARSTAAPLARRRLLALAGTAAAASVAGWFMLRSDDLRYETAVGEIRRLPLADGSIAAINTASRIRVAYGPGLRRIAILNGEVWFRVAKDPTRAFLVEAGAVRVRATGTAFSVRRRPNGSDVLVTEGAVEVWSAGAQTLKASIGAGEAAFISDEGRIKRAALEPSAVDRTLAWRSGKIDLIGQPLSAAVAEFNRYNRRQILLEDAALGGEQFDGVFRTDDPVGFAVMVRTSLDVPLDLSDPGSIRIGQAR